jgi:hypothetical protein
MISRSLEYTLTDNDQLCFIHLPKAGGTTLNAHLQTHFGPDEICEIPLWKDLPHKPPDLARPRYLAGHTYYEAFKLLPRNPVFITMLRDPIERSISQYEQLRRVLLSPVGNTDWQHRNLQEMTWEQFIETPGTRDSISNVQTRYLAAKFEPEIKSLQDIASAKEQVDLLDVDLAKRRLNEFAFVGILEEFDRSMHLLSFTFGWPLTTVQSFNMAPTRIKREDVAPAILDALAALNQLDLDLYAYAQRLFNERYEQMMNELLAHNYERRYSKDRPQPVSEIDFDLHTPKYPISGFYRSETDGTDSWRWTGPSTVSTIDLPTLKEPEHHELIIRLYIVWVSTGEILRSLRLEVNGCPVNLSFKKDKRGKINVEGRASAAALIRNKSHIRLAFHVDRTIATQELVPGSAANRQVGLAFGAVTIQSRRRPTWHRLAGVFRRTNE